MVKAHKIGDSVRIDPTEFPFMGLPTELEGQTLKVTEFLPAIAWLQVYEVEDASGNTYALVDTALVAA